jgi:predicted double-glycine peptidase
MNSRQRNMRLTVIVLMLVLVSSTPGCGSGAASGYAVTPTQEYRSLREVTNLIRVPLARQEADYTCGVAALQSILYYYGYESRQDILALRLHSDPEQGTAYPNMVSFAESLGFQVSVYTELTLGELKRYIDSRQPVLIAIQAWRESAGDWAQDWNDGHYVVAVGYDQDNFYFMDPSTLGNFTFIPNAEFLDRWHDVYQDKPLVHFGMVVTKSVSERYDIDRIKRMN